MSSTEFVYRLWSNKSEDFVNQFYTETGAINEADAIQRQYHHMNHTVEVERFELSDTSKHGEVIYETKLH